LDNRRPFITLLGPRILVNGLGVFRQGYDMDIRCVWAGNAAYDRAAYQREKQSIGIDANNHKYGG